MWSSRLKASIAWNEPGGFGAGPDSVYALTVRLGDGIDADLLHRQRRESEAEIRRAVVGHGPGRDFHYICGLRGIAVEAQHIRGAVQEALGGTTGRIQFDRSEQSLAGAHVDTDYPPLWTRRCRSTSQEIRVVASVADERSRADGIVQIANPGRLCPINGSGQAKVSDIRPPPGNRLHAHRRREHRAGRWLPGLACDRSITIAHPPHGESDHSGDN